MKKVIFISFLSFFLLSCSDDDSAKKLKITIRDKNPPIVFADRSIPSNDPTAPIILTGPSTQIRFDIVNNTDDVITIAAVSYRVTGPDGEERTGIVEDIDNPSQLIFGTIRAEADLNCDGKVERDDNGNIIPEVPIAGSCVLDSGLPDDRAAQNPGNPSFKSTDYILTDLLAGVEEEERDDLRGGNFVFEMRFEGWVGGINNPEENFFKIINFDIESNR